jgi:hypothetical protein
MGRGRRRAVVFAELSHSFRVAATAAKSEMGEKSETEAASGGLRPEGVSDEASLAFGWATGAKDVECAKAACMAVA